MGVNSLNKLFGIRYMQGDQECYSAVIPFELINKMSETLEYSDDNKYGYQRALNTTHYKRIAKKLKKKDTELVSPTSIILGVNELDFKEVKGSEFQENIFELNVDTSRKIFRVIDGQHRLKGLELASEENPTIKDYPLNVVVMIIKEGKRRTEVKVFNDINSKAKPLKMDLTILAMYRYDVLERVRDFELEEHVAIKASYLLNEDHQKDNVWKNAIKLDVNTPKSLGIVGFKSFYESIKPMCKFLIEEMEVVDMDSFSFDELMKIVDEISNTLVKEILIPSWSIVRDKWKKGFSNSFVNYNYEEFFTMFNSDYYLQKTMGSKAINHLLIGLIKEAGNIDDGMLNFKSVIEGSQLETRDWLSGGTFAGLSSLSGIKQIEKYITNKEVLRSQ